MAMFVQLIFFSHLWVTSFAWKKKDEFTAFTGIIKTFCHKKKKKKKKKNFQTSKQMLEFVRSNEMKILTGYLKKIYLFIFAKSPSIA